MRKILFLLIASLVLFSTLSAQITQNEADSIVQQRISDETRPYTVYAKENIQPEGTTIATVTGELLELDYSCWVYYISYTGETFGKYLLVKESNGNLLEVNTKNDSGPSNLAEWRKVVFEIPFTEYSLEGTSCQWTNIPYNETVIVINNREELENYITCTEGSYPEIDFSQHTLLLASGKTDTEIAEITVENLLQLSFNEYEWNIEIRLNNLVITEEWMIALIVEKLPEESHVELNITYNEFEYPIEIPFIDYYTYYNHGSQAVPCWKDLSYPLSGEGSLIIINSNDELEKYFTCMDDYPPVDFSEYTMLLASGGVSEKTFNLIKKLMQTGEREYVFEIDLSSSAVIMTPAKWVVAILTSKISQDAVVSLLVINSQRD